MMKACLLWLFFALNAAQVFGTEDQYVPSATPKESVPPSDAQMAEKLQQQFDDQESVADLAAYGALLGPDYTDDKRDACRAQQEQAFYDHEEAVIDNATWTLLLGAGYTEADKQHFLQVQRRAQRGEF